MKSDIFKTLFISCSVLCGAALSAQGIPAVTVSDVVEINETGIRQYIGRLDAIHDATIPARVSGELMKCNFKEGDFVQKDSVLFELDDAIYQAAYESAKAQISQANAQIAQATAQIAQANAQMKQAQAQIKQANANKKYADDEFKRAEKLINVEAQKSHDVAARDQALAEAQLAAAEAQIAAAQAAKATAEGNLEAAKSSLAAAQAALKNASINLSYTKIKAPFSGKIGKATYSVGNYVTPASGSLAQLTQINPVYVRFSISEPDFLNFVATAARQDAAKAGADSTRKSASELLKEYANVHITLSNRMAYEKPATITIVDNKIDRSTGTLMLWATLDNSENHLTPGALVTVQMTRKITEKKSAVPIPAIQIGPKGQFVWVLNPATNEVVQTPVTPGEVIGAYQLVSGINPGQKVLIDGMHKIIAIPGQTPKVAPTFKNVPVAK
ncbi:MAG: efflux RND transporter periplasmic adaptor subunit [Lentisphaeria bacterium]|nr:efflux RND transporter periplasmic adaptor subunit [Lentisphaeria bacterium]